MFQNIFTSFILFAALLMTSCQHKPVETQKMQLTVSIIPQEYLANFIAGDKFDIQVMLPPGSNHETYEPAPRDMEKISSSRLYLALGALDFELAWIDRFKASNPKMQIINTSQGITMLSGHEHDHDSEPDQNVQGIDPHIWLSPSCMKIQAGNICNALVHLDTANANLYKENLNKFILLADSVDNKIREKLAGSEGKSFLIYHPALAYFARDYKLTQTSIEQEGKEPSPANLSKLINISKQKGIKSVLISKEFDTRNAEVIAREIGGKVVVFDPMSVNWPENMIHLAELIAGN